VKEMFKYAYKKAQSTAEYVIVLGLIVAAVMAMQTYVKRGFQGRIKEAVDFTDQGGQNANVVNFTTGQYEPYYLSSKFNSTRDSTEKEVWEKDNQGQANFTTDEYSYRTGHQKISEAENSSDGS
jgi:hypothetical protein